MIDTNTIISAPFSEDGNPAKTFELLLLDEIENYASTDILAEIIEVFSRYKIKKRIKLQLNIRYNSSLNLSLF
ncbi:MAG: putative toxin-antitoxin system toxin component, PIN family [Nanoarchaeota archaeon]|nr:putative toxin-antitoxin system toxin component, PIN family [Nanoarchaeota archaeon]